MQVTTSPLDPKGRFQSEAGKEPLYKSTTVMPAPPNCTCSSA